MANQNITDVQKLVGNDMQEIRTILFEKFGNDYDILDHKIILVGGFLGFGQKEKVEVAYTVRKRTNQQPQVQSTYQTAIRDYKKSEDERLANNQNAILQSQTGVMMKSVLSETERMSAMMEELQRKIENVSVPSRSENHESIEKIEEVLANNDFSMNYIKKMSERIRQTFSLDMLDDYNQVERAVVDWIGESIVVAKETVRRPPHVFILVGPTGVGKTTTLIKLLTQKYLINRKEDRTYIIKLITTDTMRVGAQEQLAGWGNYLHLDVVKAENNQDLTQLFEQYKDHCDAIFVDTSGYSPNDSKHIALMKDMLEVPGLNPDIYLMMDAKTKTSDMKNIMQNYEPFGYGSVIISKCDEADVLGNVISALWEKHKEVAYITTGQSAARDICKAGPFDFIMRLKGFHIDRDHIDSKFVNKGEF